MIPIVREFFRGLRERDELDAIIPELLTAMGFEVVSRPMVGTRQYGSDVAAVGVDDDGVRKLFLFSIKKGDLNRREWDGDAEQALRPSLNEIKDVYLSGVAPEHEGLPVVICITLGGIVLENTLPMVNRYMKREAGNGIEYRLWTGDTLTRKVVDGALREEVFPLEQRTLLRRAAALVEEPDAAATQFARLIDRVASDETQDRVARARVLYLALWILTVWGREAGNLEAPYRCSEMVILRCWELLWREIEDDRGTRLAASHTLNEIVELHLRVWDQLYLEKVLPHAGSLHALGFAVWSHEAVDVNLALFETVGRVALGGLWRAWLESEPGSPPRVAEAPSAELSEIAVGLARVVRSNPALLTPITEEQGIDLTLALMLLAIVPATQKAAAYWVKQCSRATRLSYHRKRGYPVSSSDYAMLIRLGEASEEDRRKERTQGSIIQPILAAFAWGTGQPDIATEIDEFQREDLAHSNFQTWVANIRTEEKLWVGRRPVGSSLGSLKVGAEGAELIETLRREVARNTAHAELSAIRLDHWPILLLACRHHMLPPPPQTWLPLIEQVAASGVATVRRRAGPKPMPPVGLRAFVRSALSSGSHGAFVSSVGTIGPPGGTPQTGLPMAGETR